jgi:acyl-[acyl-carrier-protein]-phospholipid O-acyltransferase/long-chain-fatty-acid--[acyl-carrier-protein] ligase
MAASFLFTLLLAHKIRRKSMRTLLKKFLHRLLTLLYQVEVHGLDNYHQAGKRVLIIANHASFLDPLLLGVFLPDEITFAIDTQISQKWWLKPFLRLSQVFPMDPTHPLSLKILINHLKTDSKTVIFPEGRITRTGSLMKIYDGPGMVADKSAATILPIRIDGAEYTHFSKLKNIVPLRLFPKITLHILPPTQIHTADHIHGRARRKSSGHKLADIMTGMMFSTSHYQQTIFSALLEARSIHGGRHEVAEDLERKPLSYNALITSSIAIAKALKNHAETGEHVGLLLPNSSKTLCVLLGLQFHGRIPAMLNYSIGSSGMISACKTAQVKTVLTSRRFVELAKLTAEAQALSTQVVLLYLEDIAAQISGLDKLKALLQSKTAHYWYKPSQYSPDSAAVVLFTSGSEGAPKGVVLSHYNILANINQVKARISFNANDTVLNFLPMFHSFGFTAGTLLPVLNGMKTFFYPSPLHYSVIPEIAYEIDATIMFSTNTFLAAYGKKAHPYDFFKMRYVVAGAEKLQQSTRELWAEKFGIRILEGYGATETSPVTSVNTPMDCKVGTVGRFMPEMRYQLEPIAGIETGGKLHVAGPNIMKGYLLPANPGVLVPPASVYGAGWYDTGDIVEVDDEGFISIKGRVKRFAKVGGEMVSLTLVEQLATKAWPDAHHAAVSLANARKGEEIILLTTQKQANLKQFSDSAEGMSTINLPRKIFIVDVIPLLGSGKIDYAKATELAAGLNT